MIDIVYALLSITFAQLAGQKRHRGVQLTFSLVSLTFAGFALATTESWI